MHPSRITRLVAIPRQQLSTTALAPSHLVLGQMWMPPVPQHQQLRQITTPLGASVLNAAVLTSVLAPPVLIARHLRRKYTNNQLQNALDEARQLQDQEKRRQVFFDVARRYARNNGSRVDLKDTVDYEIDTDVISGRPDGVTHSSNISILDPHNLRYSVQKSMLGKWKVWVAVDAEFDFGSDNDSEDGEVMFWKYAVMDPFTITIVTVLRRKLEEAGGPMVPLAEDDNHTGAPQEFHFELLCWDRVISIEFNSSELWPRDGWVCKVGERRPSKSGWAIMSTLSSFFFLLL